MSQLFGKRKSETALSHVLSPESVAVAQFSQKVLIDYIISHATGDQRPYLKVTVFDVSILGLLDSGNAAAIVGTAGINILLKLGLKIDRTRITRCTVANGQTCCSVGTISTPFRLLDRVRVLDVLVVPSLYSTLILGADFWVSMDIVPDLRRNEWHFSDGHGVDIYEIVDEALLSSKQRVQLNNLLEKEFQRMGKALGSAHAAEHVIVVEPGTRPIKQRYYPVWKQKIK